MIWIIQKKFTQNENNSKMDQINIKTIRHFQQFANQ